MKPPSILWTGRLAAFPLMSHRAMSMPLMTRVVMPRLPTSLGCHRSSHTLSVSKGSWPMDDLLEVVENGRAYLLGPLDAAAQADPGDALVGVHLHHVDPGRSVDVAAVAYGRRPVPAVVLHPYIGDFHWGPPILSWAMPVACDGSHSSTCPLLPALAVWMSPTPGHLLWRIGGAVQT